MSLASNDPGQTQTEQFEQPFSSVMLFVLLAVGGAVTVAWFGAILYALAMPFIWAFS